MNFLSQRVRDAFAHDGFQKYFKNTSWIFSGKIGSMAISFLATLYIARVLGPTNYGQLSYAISFVALFGFIATLGVDTIAYRDLVKYPQKRHTILGTALTMRIIAGVMAAISASLFSYVLLKDDVSTLLVVILSSAFILNSFQIIVFDFQSRSDTRSLSIASVGISLVLNILKVLVIASHKGIIFLAFVMFLESVLYTCVYIPLYQRTWQEKITIWRFDKKYARSLLLDSAPLISLGAFSIIYARIDQVLIRHLIDAHAVGIYDAAVRVAEVWSFIPSILLTALAPAIVRAKSISDLLYNRRLGKLTILFLAISIIVAIMVSWSAPFIMRILYGPAFMAGVGVLRIYVWAFIGTSLGIVITQYLITENYRTILAAIAFIPMVVNVILNLVWIPKYGIEGSAFATLISYSLTPFMLLLFTDTRRRTVAVVHAIFRPHLHPTSNVRTTGDTLA